MATVSKFASSNAVVTTGWTSPTNAYADDTSYATASPGRNVTVNSDFGFADFSTGDIPDGSAIDSATITARAWGSNATYMTEGIRGRLSGADNGTEGTTTSTSEVTITCTLSGVTLANLRAASTTVFARVRASKGATNTAYTGSLDWVQITVDYTAPQAKSGSDSGTGTDSASVSQAKSGSDSGTGSDAASLAVAINRLNTGSGYTRGSAVAADDFSGSGTWPNADIGGAWETGGSNNNTDYTEGSGVGTMQSATTAGHVGDQMLDVSAIADVEYQVTVDLAGATETGEGGGVQWRIDSTKYVAYVAWESSTTFLLRLSYGAQNSAPNSLTQIAVATGLSKNGVYGVTIHGFNVGSAHSIRAWATNASEPTTWQIDTTDSNVTVGGTVGLVDTTNTDTGLNFDNFNVWAASGSSGATNGETGTGTETATKTESGSSTPITGTLETGTGTDASGTLAVARTSTAESGTGTDAASLAVVRSSTAESGTGTDAATLAVARSSTAESGTGTDASGTLLVARTGTAESGTGTEAIFDELDVLLATRSDSGTGTDTASLDQGTTPKTGSLETGTGSDAASLATAIAGTAESGTGTDAATQNYPLSGAGESGAGTDAASLAVARSSTAESGTGTDATSAPAVAISASDSGTGTDAATVDSGATPKTGTETGTGTDASGTLVVAGSSSETSTGTDAATLAVARTGSAETGTGSDAAAVPNRILTTVTDSATGSDVASAPVVALTTRTDGGTGADASSAPVAALAALDAGTATDAVVSVDAGGVPKVGEDSGAALETATVERIGGGDEGGRGPLHWQDYTAQDAENEILALLLMVA